MLFKLFLHILIALCSYTLGAMLDEIVNKKASFGLGIWFSFLILVIVVAVYVSVTIT